jgi:GT2 family glycosyltransferase
MDAARAELLRSRHEVDVVTAPPGERGKFENLNALLAEHPAAGRDWLLVVDDDVALPRGFLDAFLCAAERAGLELAQPAHRLHSHAAWEVTRRRASSTVRETSFVEIGPVTAFHRDVFATLLPFPAELRMGWGLDVHWAAVARERGWPIGIVDATPIAHTQQPAGSAYGREAAEREAREFLNGRPYVRRDEVRTVAVHR